MPTPYFDCSHSSLRWRPERLVPRRSGTKGVSTRFSSPRRCAIASSSRFCMPGNGYSSIFYAASPLTFCRYDLG